MKPRVLVGVDGSPESVEALRRGAQEARWREGVLEALYSFPAPESPAFWPAMPDEKRQQADLERTQKRATEWLESWLAETDVDLSGVEVMSTAVPNRKSSSALIERSEGAELVVVGARGRGGFAGLRLGSTSEQVTRHARCPVLVIRSSGDGKGGGKAKG